MAEKEGTTTRPCST
uniref:Uncharacterized protein n=1 Tax=Anopheles albimanus TaxID=7167 RepID=A0A182FJP4_ANOAL